MACTGRVYRIGAVELLAALWDLALHLDRHLAVFVAEHGAWVYALLFVIVFCETGLVVTPFLPGDSLLFVAGTIAAAGGMDIVRVMAVYALLPSFQGTPATILGSGGSTRAPCRVVRRAARHLGVRAAVCDRVL